MPAKNAAIAYLYHGFPPARERRCGEFAHKIPSQSAVQLLFNVVATGESARNDDVSKPKPRALVLNLDADLFALVGEEGVNVSDDAICNHAERRVDRGRGPDGGLGENRRLD